MFDVAHHIVAREPDRAASERRQSGQRGNFDVLDTFTNLLQRIGGLEGLTVAILDNGNGVLPRRNFQARGRCKKAVAANFFSANNAFE